MSGPGSEGKWYDFGPKWGTKREDGNIRNQRRTDSGRKEEKRAKRVNRRTQAHFTRFSGGQHFGSLFDSDPTVGGRRGTTPPHFGDVDGAVNKSPTNRRHCVHRHCSMTYIIRPRKGVTIVEV